MVDTLVNCWLDCDPGHDDLFAILLAAYSEKINLIGVSTVAGNQTIEKTTMNALNAFNLLGLIDQSSNGNRECLKSSSNGFHCPLVKGCGKPLMRAPVHCQEIHGETGLETQSKTPFPPISAHAYEYVNRYNSQPYHFTTLIYNLIKAEQKTTVICTGPLTNMALLLINYPDCVNYIEKIVLMGGACGIGNTGPVAEFNIQVDPEAAHIVFESNLPIYMVPLEVTHTAIITENVLEKLNVSSTFSKIMIDLLLFFKQTYKELFLMENPPLHDPCAVAFVIEPKMFEYKEMRVDIETKSKLSYGQTVCDIYGMSKKKKNVNVCLKMNVEEFWNKLIKAYNKANDSNRK
jgi:inosine-uridine nucleoside N-ribohydrolase